MAETIMTTVPMKEKGKAPTKTKFKEDIAELISLMTETSCPGKEVAVKEVVSLSTTRLEVESKRMDDDSAQNGGKELYSSVMFDGERNDLTFEDNGAGMTELDLVDLATIPQHSTTNTLISAIKAGKDLSKRNLFDVGFFTVFAVADKITIKSTPSGGTEWHMWESVATEGQFTVQHIQNPGLKCKTQVTLHLKKDVADNIRSSGLERFLREHNCHSSYKIKVQSYTVINSSKEGSLGPQEEAAVADVTRDPQEHVGNTPATLQESCNPNTSPKDKSPVHVPMTPGSASAHSNINIAITVCPKVEECKGEIKTVEDTNKKGQSDEAKNRMTLEEIKKTPGCRAAARLHICQLKDAHRFTKEDGSKGFLKILLVGDRINSLKTYDLVTVDEVADTSFEVGGRYQFDGIVYDAEKEIFKTIGQTLPQLVKSGKEKKK